MQVCSYDELSCRKPSGRKIPASSKHFTRIYIYICYKLKAQHFHETLYVFYFCGCWSSCSAVSFCSFCFPSQNKSKWTTAQRRVKYVHKFYTVPSVFFRRWTQRSDIKIVPLWLTILIWSVCVCLCGKHGDMSVDVLLQVLRFEILHMNISLGVSPPPYRWST